MADEQLRGAANALLDLCKTKKLTLATAEILHGRSGRRYVERNFRLVFGPRSRLCNLFQHGQTANARRHTGDH